MNALAPGVRAPDFDLATDGGGRIALSALRGRTVVLYFYPKDDTEGCTIEATDFTARAEEFAAAGALVIGVSPDSVKSHDRFKAKHSLAVLLASDPEHDVIGAYGSWVEKTMFGRRYMGVSRDTFLIDGEGRLARIWRKVRVRGHVADVLSAVNSL